MAASLWSVFPYISPCPSWSRRLCLCGDRPDETRQLTRDCGSDHRRQLSRPGELAIPSAQPFLSLPCDVADGLGQALLAQQLLAADPCGKSVAPGRFDQHASRCSVAGLGNAALASRAAAGMLG